MIVSGIQFSQELFFGLFPRDRFRLAFIQSGQAGPDFGNPRGLNAFSFFYIQAV